MVNSDKWRKSRSGDTEQHLTGSQHRGQLNKHLQQVNATQASVHSVEKSHILDSSVQLKMQSAIYNCRKKGHYSGQCLSKSSKEATRVLAVINYTFLSNCNLMGIENLLAQVLVMIVDYIHVIYT